MAILATRWCVFLCSTLLLIVFSVCYAESDEVIFPAEPRSLNTQHHHGSSSGSSSGSTTSGHQSGHTSGAHHVGHHKSTAFDPTVFLLIAFTGSVLSQQLSSMLPDFMRLPHSLVLYSFGMAISAIAFKSPDSEFGASVNEVADIDPHIIFWVFLPMLLYEDAASSDWHVVRRVLPSAMLLALPGVIVNTMLTALVLYLLDITDLKAGCLLGSILSATDPVAVIGALNALQAPAKLSSIIAGESLLNDGSAVVCFKIFMDVAAGRKEFEIGEAIWKLFKLAGGGVALGLGVALCAHIWLAKTRNFSVELLLIIICIFGLFFAAEHPEVEFSGVLAVVTFGFFMAALGKKDLDVEKEHEHHAIVNFLAYISNEAIFIVAGIVGYRFSFQEPHICARDWLDLLFLYIGVHVTRGLTVGICYPILHRTGYRLNLKEATICVVGGLRGAVGLALALLVLHDSDIDVEVRHKICFHTNGIVLGTLFINGLVVTPIYKQLKIQSPTRAKHHHELLKMLLKHADELVKYRMYKLGKHWFFQDCNRDVIDQVIPTLLDGLEHAEEDYYGRKKHTIDVVKRTSNRFDQIVKENKQTPEEIQTSLVNRLKLIELNAKRHDHNNIFQANLLLLKRATGDKKDEKIRKLKAMMGIKSNKSNKTNNSEAKTVAADGSAVQAPPGEVKKSSWSAKEEETKEVLRVAVDGQKTEVDIDFGSPPPADDDDGSPSLGSPSSPGSSDDDDDEADLDDASDEERAKDQKALGKRVISASRFKHFQAFEQKDSIRRERTESGKSGVYAESGGSEELGLAIELTQNLVNAQRAAYKQMLETGALDDSAYSFLHASLDFQVEAIDGDLKGYRFLRKEFPELHKQDQITQLHHAQRVSLTFIKTHLDTTEMVGYRTLLRLLNHRSRVCEWMLMRRNVKTLLAYLMVLKQNMEELEHLKHEYFGKDSSESAIVTKLITELNDVQKIVSEELAVNQVKRQPAMFKLYEHVLFARLQVVQQAYVLNELTEEGNLEQTDVESFIENITEPAMKALERWVPSIEQLTAIGGKASTEKYIPWLDTVITMYNSLTLEPI